MHPINKKIQLPCGVYIDNRLVKAAMTERISNRKFEPTTDHFRLYEAWSDTGAGLLITGNVTIDRIHIESAGNVCFDDEGMLPKLKKWSAAGRKNGNHCWVQISHAGRQTNRFSTSQPLAPSAVQLKKMGLFGKPKMMSEGDIGQVIDGFVRAAIIAKKAEFTGVQIHAAHGYLLSQFLSPRTNQRRDLWGGSLENRCRLLVSIVRGIRSAVGPNFPISVKLNSSDFQKGGFSQEDSLEVVKKLDQEGVDLLEISGGTYERLAFFMLNEAHGKQSTRQREAYFIDFAKKIRAVSQIPLMVTGGFRSFDFCNEVLQEGALDMIGMARPFLTNIQDMAGFLRGEIGSLENLVLRTGISQFDDAAEGGYYARQLIRMARGKKIKSDMNALWCSNFLIFYELGKTLAKKI